MSNLTFSVGKRIEMSDEKQEVEPMKTYQIEIRYEFYPNSQTHAIKIHHSCQNYLPVDAETRWFTMEVGVEDSAWNDCMHNNEIPSLHGLLSFDNTFKTNRLSIKCEFNGLQLQALLKEFNVLISKGMS